jgi:hypothetical protein
LNSFVLEFGGRRLPARAQQFLEIAARLVGVLYYSVRRHRVRMAHQAAKASDRSRTLQLSMMMRSPLQGQLRLVFMS